jgi:transcriptional regulator with XRE-family HTH domain
MEGLYGGHIHDLRTRLGMTQEAFSKKLGVSQTYLGRIERGHRKVPRRILPALMELKHDLPQPRDPWDFLKGGPMTGDHVRGIRRRLRMSQEDFAQSLGVRRLLITMIEKRGPCPVNSRRVEHAIYCLYGRHRKDFRGPESLEASPCRHYRLFLSLTRWESLPKPEVRERVSAMIRQERVRLRTIGVGEGFHRIHSQGSAWLVNFRTPDHDMSQTIPILPGSYLFLELSGRVFLRAKDFHRYIHEQVLRPFYETLRTGTPFPPVHAFYMRGTYLGSLRVRFRSNNVFL